MSRKHRSSESPCDRDTILDCSSGSRTSRYLKDPSIRRQVWSDTNGIESCHSKSSSSVPPLHVPRQTVPGAAIASDQMSAVADGPDGKGPGVENGMNDASENPEWSVRATLI